MDAVIDTNVVLSALMSRRGASSLVLQAAATAKFKMLATPPVFLEYEEVLKRPEHQLATGLSLDDIDRVLRDLAAVIVPVEVQFLWRPQLSDPDDEMVLEAAINGQARRIVTFNVKDFRPAELFGIKAVTPQQFLEELKS
ncbi:MAG: putative toxin-antitoxin system toxin component, PIN family [Micropepsaceae bacterium]